jgi:hypothetical protein
MDMVVEGYGQAAWASILDSAGLDDSVLIGAQPYPDEITFRLISAVAAKAGLTVDETLRSFGQYWIKAADAGPYANVMNILGGSLLESLENLDRMHASIQIAMPEARLPYFAVLEHDESRIKIAYHSTRQGLESFVTGLFEGLLNRFDKTGNVIFSGTKEDFSLFEISLSSYRS